MSDGNKESGFTLIEVLLAMTLLSIMMVLLFGSLKISSRSWDLGEQKISEVSDMASVVNFFQRHLSVARPLWNDFKPDQKLLSFQGGRQSIQFVSSFPASAGRAGFQLISVALQRNGSGQALRVTLKPFFPIPDGEEWLEEDEVLINGVSAFSLAYFGSDDTLSDGRWLDEWLERDRQPSLVRINISLENGLYWPEMIFALKMSSSDGTTSGFNDEDDPDDDDDDDDDDDGDGDGDGEEDLFGDSES